MYPQDLNSILRAALLAFLVSATSNATFSNEREQIGTAMGEPVYRDQIRTEGFTLRDELHRLFSAPARKTFREENLEKITPTDDELAAATDYFRKRRRELLMGEYGGLLRKQLADVAKELENDDLPDEERAVLKLRKESIEQSLDPEDKSVAGAAVLTLRKWKFQRFLYEKYGGGRILWQQFGIEAFDAMHKLLKEREATGDFRITDPKLRAKFYDYWTNPKMHGSFLTSDVERIRTTFLEPPWLP